MLGCLLTLALFACVCKTFKIAQPLEGCQWRILALEFSNGMWGDDKGMCVNFSAILATSK